MDRESQERLDQEIGEALARLPLRKPSSGFHERLQAALARAPGPTPSRRFERLFWAGSGIAASFAVGLVLVLWLLPASPPVVPPTEPALPLSICQVREVRGEVLRQTGDRTVPLRFGEQLGIRDLVLTGTDARAEFGIDTDARLVLYQGSRLEVAGLTPEVRTFALAEGRVRVDLLNGGQRAVRVEARGVRAAVEGRTGTFVAMVTDRDRAAIGALQGEAVVTAGGRAHRLKAGEQLRLTGDDPAPARAALSERVELQLLEPSGPLVAGERIAIAGASDSHARLWINRRPQPLDRQGRFRLELAVKKDESIELLAEDLAGNASRLELGPAIAALHLSDETKPERKVEVRSYKVNW